MNAKTRNTPTAPGALTPAELTRRTLDRFRFIAGATATVTATVTALIYLLFL